MSEVRVEQLEQFFKQVGLEDSDITTLKAEEVQDFTPYLDKIKSGIIENIKTDESFIDGIVRPYKDAPIGKEKQLKKEVRKFFGLQLSEDELIKTPLSDMLKKGTENFKSQEGTALEDYKNKYSELLEENERLKNEIIPSEVQKVEQAWRNKIQEKDIKEELTSLVASETQVPKENLAIYATTFQGYLSQLGYKLHIDEKRNLSVRDSDGVVAKNSEGGILRVKEALRDFAAKLTTNTHPKGVVTSIQTPNGKTNSNHNLLQLLGKGF
jgi:hypothetical protein